MPHEPAVIGAGEREEVIKSAGDVDVANPTAKVCTRMPQDGPLRSRTIPYARPPLRTSGDPTRGTSGTGQSAGHGPSP